MCQKQGFLSGGTLLLNSLPLEALPWLLLFSRQVKMEQFWWAFNGCCGFMLKGMFYLVF